AKRRQAVLAALTIMLVSFGLYFLFRPARTGNQQLENKHALNPEADFACREARAIWSKRTAKTLENARARFKRVTELDPNYAPAWSGLADSYSMLSDYGEMLPSDAYPQARDAAKKALELDDRLAEAHTSLAWIKAVYEWDFSESENEFRRAIQLDPDYGTA